MGCTELSWGSQRVVKSADPAANIGLEKCVLEALNIARQLTAINHACLHGFLARFGLSVQPAAFFVPKRLRMILPMLRLRFTRDDSGLHRDELAGQDVLPSLMEQKNAEHN